MTPQEKYLNGYIRSLYVAKVLLESIKSETCGLFLYNPITHGLPSEELFDDYLRTVTDEVNFLLEVAQKKLEENSQ